MKSILYYVKPEKIINGTLFYCMEYFLTCNELENVQLLLKCNEKTYNFIIECFSIKYNYNYKLNKQIIHFNKYTELPKLINDNVLILDNKTFNKMGMLVKYKKLLYSENTENNLKHNTKVYGFYDYQNFNIKVRLKLGLVYCKHYKELYNRFESSIILGNTDKKANKFVNLMEIKNWVYTHNGFDTNNRFIPEARYFNKTLIVDKINFNDSIKDRLNCSLENLILDSSDILIKDFLSENR